MKQLAQVLVRYVLAVLMIMVAGMVSDVGGLWLLLPVAVVSVKFLVYDGVITALKAKFPVLKLNPWHLLGYGLAVLGDMYFVYGANLDQVDAGFAFLGTIVVTPWILAGAFAAVLINTYIKRK